MLKFCLFYPGCLLSQNQICCTLVTWLWFEPTTSRFGTQCEALWSLLRHYHPTQRVTRYHPEARRLKFSIESRNYSFTAITHLQLRGEQIKIKIEMGRLRHLHHLQSSKFVSKLSKFWGRSKLFSGLLPCLSFSSSLALSLSFSINLSIQVHVFLYGMCLSFYLSFYLCVFLSAYLPTCVPICIPTNLPSSYLFSLSG